MLKIWVGWMVLKGEKKWDGLRVLLVINLFYYSCDIKFMFVCLLFCYGYIKCNVILLMKDKFFYLLVDVMM